jgi:hypothetical protein
MKAIEIDNEKIIQEQIQLLTNYKNTIGKSNI